MVLTQIEEREQNQEKILAKFKATNELWKKNSMEEVFRRQSPGFYGSKKVVRNLNFSIVRQTSAKGLGTY